MFGDGREGLGSCAGDDAMKFTSRILEGLDPRLGLVEPQGGLVEAACGASAGDH